MRSLKGSIHLTRTGNSIMEHLALAVKGLLAIVLLLVSFSSIYIYRVWSRDTDRRVKIGIMGFSIEVGPALKESKEDNTDTSVPASTKEDY
jgi:hypothetical protein